MEEQVERRVSVANGFVIVATLILGGYVGLFLRDKLPPQIPLFYSRPWGEEQLATPSYLVIPLALIVLCGGIFLVAKKIVADRTLKRLVLGGIVVIEMLIL